VQSDRTCFRRSLLALRLLLGPLQNPAHLRRLTRSTCLPTGSQPCPGPRQLLIDVSVFARSDAGTGIQRVTKALLGELTANPPKGYVVRIVRATRWHRYHHVHADTSSEREKLRVHSGDVFLGLDLASRILPRQQRQLLEWRAAGAKLCFVMYDMLPLLRPDWFTQRNSRAYRAWIRTVAIHADSVACISQVVARQFSTWLSECAFQQDSPDVKWFHLGAETSPGRPRTLLAAQIQEIVRRSYILMVGTIEPRKGYAQILDAFDTLWRNGQDVQLVIVGRIGWKVEALVSRLRKHPEANRRLHWLTFIDDESLSALYAGASGVLIASEAEGFGLPILEGATHGKPLLLRDLPVFREVAGEAASYFSAVTPDRLAEEVSQWLRQLSAGTATQSTSLPRQNWAESASSLLAQLPLEAPASNQLFSP
jgi:glycosyltransferase involved in cell wall biosynthesis